MQMSTIELSAPAGFGGSAQSHATVVGGSASSSAAVAVASRRDRLVGLARIGIGEVRDHYAGGTARLRLAGSALMLFYVGGAAMFYLHAIYRGEQGPAIGHVWHWMLDSTLGLVGLTPVLVVLLPVAVRLARGSARVEPLVVGGLFALLTTPGPVLHKLVAGADTPLARVATSVFGTDPQVAASHVGAAENSMVTEVLLQAAVGLPVYVLLAQLVWLALPATRTSRAARAAQALHPSTATA